MKNNLYLQAPNYHVPGAIKSGKKYLFLGGSITGAWNWQEYVANKLANKINIFNPRRDTYNKLDPNIEREQIVWEFQYLNIADILVFYFSEERLAPITLFEFGKFLGQTKYNPWKKIYICIHPNYARKNDVIIQTELENPELAKNIYFNLDEMVNAIIKNEMAINNNY